MIEFTVEGEPSAQGRPRFTTFGGQPRAYDDSKSKDYKMYVRMVASLHKPPEPLKGHIAICIKIYRSTPKSFSKKKTEQAENGQLRPITKPDASNYVKGIEDALNGLIWKDDSQIVDMRVFKYYSNNPRIEIQIQELGEVSA